jgi:hypothetical protein
MPIAFQNLVDMHVRPIAAAIKTIGVAPGHAQAHPGTAVQPFVTISRQAGAGGVTLANRLVEHLNRVDPGELPWTAWDKELVQKVAEEHHISQALVETMEDHGQSWLQEFLGGLRIGESAESASELRVFWKTATAIRAIAQVGRCVIVGRGASFITARMPGGVRIRLVAPLAFRIRNYASIFGVSPAEAEVRVKELDHNRDAFYRRHWPGQTLCPENFTATFNAATIGEVELVNAVAAMIRKSIVQGGPT